MKQYLKFLLVIAILGGSSAVFAQVSSKQSEVQSSAPQTASAVSSQSGPDLYFVKNVHDFGSVKEEGKVFCTFEFENTGDMPLEIRKVTASCGCTTPAFIKEPIAPGAKSQIEVAYNTVGRPGNFSKTITVYSNSIVHPTYSLNIRGTVVSKNNSVEGLYPKAFGGLRLTKTTCAFGQMTIGGIKTLTIPIYNNNEENPISIALVQVPKHLKVTVSNTEILPSETAIITINYLTKEAKDYGPREDAFYLMIKGDKAMQKITVTADLKEDFSMLKPNANIPQAQYSNTTIDFGTIQQGDSKSAVVELTNEGGAPLLIRKCETDIPALSLKVDKKEIAVGKTAKIRVDLNTSSLHSKLRYYIDVITNDPLMPVRRIFIVATVEDRK